MDVTITMDFTVDDDDDETKKEAALYVLYGKGKIFRQICRFH